MKKIIRYSFLLSLFYWFTAYSVGLGEMTVHSFLNQPFDAEIELLDVGPIPLAEIKVAQASAEDFQRVGLERAYAVDLLAFMVEKNAAGKPVVKIRSTERIDDPYLQILVDLAWAKGQVYRDYTILLDPPDYQLVVIKKHTSQAVTSSRTAQESNLRPGVIEKSIITQVSASTDANKQSYGEVTYGPTLAKESIWQIAQRYKTPDVILQQIILTIVGTNPQAFAEDNLNGLKPGMQLSIPDTITIRKVPADLAKLEVFQHDSAWQSKQPVHHVLLPPYINGQPAGSESTSSLPAAVIPQSTLPRVPVFSKPLLVNSENPTLIPQSSFLLSAGQDIAPSPATDKMSAQQAQVLQVQAQTDIAATAMESVREANSTLVEQLRLLRSDNLRLQQQLQKREQEIKKLQQQVLQITQRLAVAGQVSTQSPESEGNSLWPRLFLLALIAVGSGLYWWFWQRPQRHLQPDANAGREDKVIIPPPADEDVAKVEIPAAEVIPPLEPDNANTIPVPQEFISPISDEQELLPVETQTPTPQLDLPQSPEILPPLAQTEPEQDAEGEPEPEPEPKDEHLLEFEPVTADMLPLAAPQDEKMDLTPEPEVLDNNVIDFMLEPADGPSAEFLPAIKPAKLFKSKRAFDTLLDLAKTYLSMGDKEAARQSLLDVLEHGNDQQKVQAQQLLNDLEKN